MRTLPGGTVTLLFTDIEGSTRLLHELGDGYAEVLAEHRRVLRGAFERHGGVEVDTQGDAFFVAFERAGDAATAAVAVQAALAGGAVRVRIGVHTGEPLVTDEGYVGVDVHRAARIMGAAHGGQVLVSDATRQLLGERHDLTDLGEHRLKDLAAPQRLHQLGDGSFRPPRTLYRTNLPVQATPLVGRERELRELDGLLRAHRLLTLTGPGGSGKTRLALQVAAEASERFPDGMFWVPLQALRDPALVERAIAASLAADGDLADHVSDKHLLVLLDNFEQVADAAPALAELLEGTPNAKFLVTSREPLQLGAERRYLVEPLPDGDAATLFAERAQAVSPGFRPTPEIAEICRRLDGLPLAIELAAARVALLEPTELLERLDRRLPLLATRSRDAPARQRTLRTAIEWSYELLDSDEQQLFRRLAVFRGSFTVGASEAVCGADVDTLESLVVKSLVRRWGSGRLGLLDTIREYALERLEDAPEEAERVRLAHVRHFLELADSANLNAGRLRPGGQRLDIAMAEQDNMRGALAWATRNGAAELGLELATALEQFWAAHDPDEGARWFARLLDRPEAAGMGAETMAHALRAYASSVDIGGDDEGAVRLYARSLALFEELGDDEGRAVLLHRLGIQAMRRGELAQARALVQESKALHESAGNRWGLAQTIGTLGAIERDEHHDEQALELLGESAALAREVGVPWWEAGMLAELGQLALRAGRLDEAAEQARASLQIAERLRDRGGKVFGVGLLACLAAERGERSLAARLWSAVEAESIGAPLGGWRRHRAACEARIRAALGAELDAPAGPPVALDDAVALALGKG